MSDINKMISMTLDKYHQLYNECDTLKTNLADALRAVNTQTDLYRGALQTLAQERDAFGKKETEMIDDMASLKSIIRGQTGEITRLKEPTTNFCALCEEAQKEIERLKGEHEHCKNDYDEAIKNRWDACLDRDHWRTLASGAKEALGYIAEGRAHIGNDANGNVFGLPDIVMCRNKAKAALAAFPEGGDSWLISIHAHSAGKRKTPMLCTRVRKFSLSRKVSPSIVGVADRTAQRFFLYRLELKRQKIKP